MYAQFFGLRELPFNNTPDPRFFFATPDHEEALASLIYAVQERKGFVLLTGEIGAGKTLVSRMMLRHFGTLIGFATINHAVQDARDLLESICSEFELAIPADASRTTLVRVLHDHLLAQFARNHPVVLVLDEAQNLSVDSFEQLRMIGNLEADDAKLLQIVIVGQPELQQRFASTELYQLRQRIFRSFHLPAMSRETTEGYIRHRLSVAGAEDHSIFEPDAIDRIYDYAKGVPRVINTLCDNAMLSAYSAGRREITGKFLDIVIAQMMGVASPSTATATNDQATPATPAARATAQAPAVAAPHAPSPQSRDATAPRTPSAPIHPKPAQASPQSRTRPTPGTAAPPPQSTESTGPTSLQRQLNRETQTLVDKARIVRSELEPLIRRGESLLTRTGLVVRDLDRKEDRLQNAERVVSGRVRELRTLLDRAQRLMPARPAGPQATRHNARQLTEEAATCRRLADRITQRAHEAGDDLVGPDLEAERARVLRSVEAVRSKVDGSRKRAEELRKRLRSISSASTKEGGSSRAVESEGEVATASVAAEDDAR